MRLSCSFYCNVQSSVYLKRQRSNFVLEKFKNNKVCFTNYSTILYNLKDTIVCLVDINGKFLCDGARALCFTRFFSVNGEKCTRNTDELMWLAGS